MVSMEHLETSLSSVRCPAAGQNHPGTWSTFPRPWSPAWSRRSAEKADELERQDGDGLLTRSRARLHRPTSPPWHSFGDWLGPHLSMSTVGSVAELFQEATIALIQSWTAVVATPTVAAEAWSDRFQAGLGRVRDFRLMLKTLADEEETPLCCLFHPFAIAHHRQSSGLAVSDFSATP